MKPFQPAGCDLDVSGPAIQRCEQRLALSASLGAEFLLEMSASDAAPGNLAPIDNRPMDESASLLNQAARFRGATGIDGSGQTVAVIDTGIAYDHVSFRGDAAGRRGLGGGLGPGYRVVGGYDFAEDDSDPYDDGPAGFHGTHVTSLLAGQAYSQDGSSQGGLPQGGIAPGADLVALRVFDDAGTSRLEWVESALQWVIENQDTFESPITTVNLSVGAVLNDANRMLAMDLLEDELQTLREDGILVFAAAGNFFDPASPESPQLLYPASSQYVVPVSAVDSTGNLSDFAQRRDGIFAAPGEMQLGSVPDHVFGIDGQVDDFASLSGTSMATPQLAGISVLVRQTLAAEGIEATPQAILQRIESLSSLSTDNVSGLSFRTVNLDDLVAGDPVAENLVAENLVAGETDNLQPPRPIELPATDASQTLSSFLGSNESESVQLDLRDGLLLRVDDQTYSLSPEVTQAPIVIDVGGGSDDLQIFGSERSEQLILHARESGNSILTRGELTIELRGFENVRFIGGGGADRVTLFDSQGDDTLRSEPTRATLAGVGFQFDVEQVDRIFVHSVNGGQDVAFLRDGLGDDRLAIRPQFTSLRSQASELSEETFQLAFGFDRVFAFANQAGIDSIEINDSTGDDKLSISQRRTVIAGPGYNVSANGFESTIASANNGGNDVARIFTTTDPDNALTAPAQANRLEIQNDRIQWTSEDNAVRIARGFARNEVFENFQRVDLLAVSRQTLAPLPQGLTDQDEHRVSDSDASRSVFAQWGRNF